MTMIEVDQVVMIDRALAQTARAGLTYAVVPQPWLIDWVGRGGFYGDTFDWTTLCIHPRFRIGDTSFPCVDGDVYLCLLAYEHEGPCGYDRLINPTQVRGPIAEGFEGIITFPGPHGNASHS